MADPTEKDARGTEPSADLPALKAMLEEPGASEKLKALLPGLIAELEHARRALATVLDRVGDAGDWDNPSSALEAIGDAVNSDRYPVWERYEASA